MNQEQTEINELLGLLGALSLSTAINSLKKVPYIPYPVSLSTADVVLLQPTERGKFNVLVGRKPGREEWQFPGGFRDPRETNEFSAKRELMEECNLQLELDRFQYMGSMFIDDVRYRESCHKITTNLFVVHDIRPDEAAIAKAGDDLAEVKWIPFEKEQLQNIRPIHQPIFDIVYRIFMEDESTDLTLE